MKGAKEGVKKHDNIEAKQIYKICKLYRMMLVDDEENKFEGYLNETEYTHQFIHPLFKEVLYNCDIKFRLGECHLQCAAAETTDDQRTQAGPKIDIILIHKVHKFAVSICELSGPNWKTNRNHFLGDRNKLAKNMRSILNHIEEAVSTPNITAFKKIKIYGFQMYLNNIYVYSLQPIAYGYHVFKLEKSFSIPVSLSLLRCQLPTFIGWVWMILNIHCFIEKSKEEEILEIDSQPCAMPSSQESVSNKR